MLCRQTPDNITSLLPNEIFVFGSNMNGAHAGGAAKIAMRWGAKWGEPDGIQGQTYALPTMDIYFKPLDLDTVKRNVIVLLACVQNHKREHFLITKVGCGIAGFTIEQIAPLFKDFTVLHNCSLPKEFIDIINN